MNEEELLSTQVHLAWLNHLQVAKAAIPARERAWYHARFDYLVRIGEAWRSALLSRYNKNVSAAQQAADAPDEQQQGG